MVIMPSIIESKVLKISHSIPSSGTDAALPSMNLGSLFNKYIHFGKSDARRSNVIHPYHTSA